jgi:ADP-heptose:LPS heptosyltransferase
MAKVLVIRLSAFGDVAMLVPVVYSAAQAYPDSRFIVLTRKLFEPLFNSLARNIETMTFDSQKEHKGILGLLKLKTRIKKRNFTHIADTHDVIRTKIIRSPLLGFPQIKTAHIDKGRSDKKKLIQSKDTSQPLISTTERYKQVFQELGFDFGITFKNLFEGKQANYSILGDWRPKGTKRRIGIAPFARHEGKIYPLEKMEKAVEMLSSNPDSQLFLFGGSNKEKRILKKWAETYPNTICTVGKLFLQEELLLIHSLDALVSMDSANMHLASLVETPVISIWGATHPSFGFYGFGQDLENAVQIDLECRPCSVYGNKPCARKDYACMNWIEPTTIVEHIEAVLKATKEN